MRPNDRDQRIARFLLRAQGPRPLPGPGHRPARQGPGREDAGPRLHRLQIARSPPPGVDLRGTAGVQAQGRRRRPHDPDRQERREVHPALPGEDQAGQGSSRSSSRRAKSTSPTTRPSARRPGSYYTPDPIVEYIVAHTVGPVLDEKLEALRPEFRKVRKTFDNELQKSTAYPTAGMSSKDKDGPPPVAPSRRPTTPTRTWWNGSSTCKVLDPAMGSGHFLVEAVDFDHRPAAQVPERSSRSTRSTSPWTGPAQHPGIARRAGRHGRSATS